MRLRELLLERAVRRAEQRARVAHLELRSRTDRWIAGGSARSRSVFEIDGAAAPGARRDLLVGEPEVLDELLVGAGLLERVQLLALEVLDQRLLERGVVVGLAHERGDRLEPDPPCGAPSALPRDELEAVAGRAHEHRLEQPDLADRVGERAEGLLVELVARLVRVRLDRGDRRSPAARAALGRVRLGRARRDQGAEPSTQPARSRHGSPPWPDRGTPWRPRDVESNTMIGCPNDGASTRRTVRGTTVS